MPGVRGRGMRAYYLPMAAGGVLALSAFLPRLRLGQVGVGGVPAVSALWTLGLGLAAMLLSFLSVLTRKNSRHPLLLVGLVALGIEFLGWKWMEHSVSEQAWASSQAAAIVAGGTAVDPGRASMAPGLYLALLAAAVISGFGLTIVMKKAAAPYAIAQDDDL
jgi:hypothetical protein